MWPKTDIEGRITTINKAMQTLLGANSDNLVGAKIEDVFKLEEATSGYKDLFSPDATNRASDVEVDQSGSAGERVLKVIRQPVRSPNSRKVDRQVWTARDITQLKLADKARDEFLDSATHELRTPLANIKAYAETLALDDFNDVQQQQDFCNIINSEATRLSRFIDELLDVSSLEAGSLVVRRQKVELARLLDDIVGKIQPTMDQKEIKLAVHFDEKLPEINVDKDKFTTSIVNLLGNAAKYTPDGGRVSFRARVADRKLLIEVEDSGIGISDTDLPKIFDKFYRSEDERALDQTGSGLGLAFTKEVIKLHNGSVSVESQIDEGSLFTITLPLE